MDDLQEIKGLLAFLRKVQIDDKPGPVICFQLKLCLFKLIEQIIQSILDITLQGDIRL